MSGGTFPNANFELPGALVNALARRECVIVVGSGVSAASVDERDEHPPTWKDLIARMKIRASDKAKVAVDKLLKGEDFLMAAEVLVADIGPEGIYEVLEDSFSRRGPFRHNQLHVLLGRLNQLVYLSPNYDTIFETYMRTNFREGMSVKKQTQRDILPWIRSGGVLLIKNHGSIDDRDSIVLTRRQYAEERVKNFAFYKVVDALFLTKTVLFVGCGLSDPDFQLLMEDAALTHPMAPRHYMIKLRVPEDEGYDEATCRLRNLEMVYYEPDYSVLENFLEYLVSEVESEMLKLGFAKS